MNEEIANGRPEVSPINENTVLLRFADKISVGQARRVASAGAWLEQHFAPWILDCVPAYTTLLLYFDSERIDAEAFCDRLLESLDSWQQQLDKNSEPSDTTRLVTIPVYYHPEVAPDLRRIAEARNMSVDEVAGLHLERTYTVYTVGFAAGFAYLGNVDSRIAEPRLSTPREQVPKGSVGIAGRQTGIYPQALPGGWNIIGRTPLELFSIDDAGEPQCLYKMGDSVEFFAIERDDFIARGGEL